MYEVRFHGRGGQGVVTAAEVLSVAAFLDGRWSQAFPSFGSERTGAPVVSFCRIDDREIRTREPIQAPDALVVQDPTLLHTEDLVAGVRRDALVLVNSPARPDELGASGPARWRDLERVVTVPATRLARTHTGRPVPNMVLLGAFAAASRAVTIESVTTAIRQRFSGAIATANAAAALEAFELVASLEHEELAGATTD